MYHPFLPIISTPCHSTAFNVDIPNFAEEGGVLIEVPADQLEETESDLGSGSLVMAQIEDGFTKLARVEMAEFTAGRRNDVPGDGSIFKAKVTKSEEPLNVWIGGSGIDFELKTNHIQDAHVQGVRNSDIKIKADKFGDSFYQDFHISGEKAGSGLEDCNKESGCTPHLNVFVQQGSFEQLENYELMFRANLKVNDPTGTFDCEKAAVGEWADGISCSVTDEEIIFGDPLPCTNSRRTARDIFYCKNEVPIDSVCGRTPVVPPPKRITSAGIGPLAQPAPFQRIIGVLILC